ncbi:MAG: thiolase family protein [Clostridia bacterium]|nr:thiolase family protein [Clostridia bacterium]
MREAVIIEAVRTPIGRRKGLVGLIRPDELAALVLSELIRRAGIDASLVEDVIMGCVSQIGEQSMNIARNALLIAGFPKEIPGTTIDRQCGSSQQAVHFAAQAILAGDMDVVIAAGVESMTRVPMGSTLAGAEMSPKLMSKYTIIPQGLSAELIAEKWGFSREQLDSFSFASHQKAVAATQAGRFKREIMPLEVSLPDGTTTVITQDEGPRPDTSLEKMATLQPAFKTDGKITAGNSSQISDGAAALLLMSLDRAQELGLKPRARVVARAVVADDPTLMLTAPIPATKAVLGKAGMTIDDIDLYEVNEAFAPVPLAWLQETGADPSKLNTNGGAIALGHPLGASGARLMTTLLYELERSGGRYGLQTMCEGGGMANATIIERL